MVCNGNSVSLHGADNTILENAIGEKIIINNK